MKKIKNQIGVLAFMGLAAINFTQSESSFISKAFASSTNSCSGNSSSTTAPKKHACIEKTDYVTIDHEGIPITYNITYEECIMGNKISDCNECKQFCEKIFPD
jgi:hypothetical protein